jgi:molybdopterin converting factor small subunit
LKIKLRYFALFREQAGRDSELIEFAGGTAAELFKTMAEIHSDLKTEAAALVAVNDEMREWETILIEGDEVLFFPPVAGG